MLEKLAILMDSISFRLVIFKSNSQTTLSFSDVLSPNDDIASKTIAAVTDSGPLRMRTKSSTIRTDADLSTHHFDAWASPAKTMSQP